MARFALALPALLLACSTAAISHAQPAPVAASADASTPAAAASADSLFREGAALLKAGRVEEACGKLEQSQSLEPAIGTLGLLAFCHELSGKLATAMREYGEVAELAHLAGQNGREQVARERVTELAGRVSRLSVVLTETSREVEVFLDARRLGAGELGTSTPVDAGTFELRIQGKGVEPWSQKLSVPADGSTLRVVVPRLRATAAAPVAQPAPAAPAPAPLPAPPTTSSVRRPVAWASFGVGALGVGLGGYFGLSALAAESDSEGHCRANACDRVGVDARARALASARISTIAFTVGAIGATAGAVLLLSEPPGEPRQSAALGLLPGGASVSLERSF